MAQRRATVECATFRSIGSGMGHFMSVHPSCLPDVELLKQCTLRNDRRGGPGGQHRNKVETAVVIEHHPTGIVAEASERRSQVDNRRVAIQRLRLALAIGYRSSSLDPSPSTLWRERSAGGRLSVAKEHEDLPCLLAELLDRLLQLDYGLPACAEFFGVSGSQLIKLLRQAPLAFSQVNAERVERGMHKLK